MEMPPRAPILWPTVCAIHLRAIDRAHAECVNVRLYCCALPSQHLGGLVLQRAKTIEAENKYVTAGIALGLRNLRLESKDSFELTTVFKCQ
jgi:hypothetical protein